MPVRVWDRKEIYVRWVPGQKIYLLLIERKNHNLEEISYTHMKQQGWEADREKGIEWYRDRQTERQTEWYKERERMENGDFCASKWENSPEFFNLSLFNQ